MSNENYYNNGAISQTRLKKILNHPLSYKNHTSISGPSLVLGSLVDILLLTPDKIKESFYIRSGDSNSVSDIIKIIWKEYYEQCKILNNLSFHHIDKDLLDKIAIDLNYRKNQDKARLSYILQEKHYFKELLDSEGRQIIDIELYHQAATIVESLKTNKYTSEIIASIDPNLTQYEIYFTLPTSKFKLKALLDWIEIDEKNKTVRPWDLKTTSDPTSKFKNSVYKYRYDFQAAFYSAACQIHFPDYKVLPFRFLVESTKFTGSPLIYECSDYTIQVGSIGGNVGGKEYKGFEDALKKLNWHTENDIWDYTQEETEQNGILIL